MRKFRGIRLFVLAMLVFAATSLTGVGEADASKRVALVIGNGSYGTIADLQNPASDARLMAKTLRAVGFEVIEGIDLDFRGMRRLIKEFGRLMRDSGSDTVAMFYFAGHGVQSGAINFLLPVSLDVQDEADLDIEAISAQDVLTQMESAENAVNLVILDACRNNPYESGTRSVERGLARMDAPTGSIIAYATRPGDVSMDGRGRNSPYTQALASAIRKQDLSVEEVFKLVRVSVIERTSGKQTPWEETSLTGRFVFNPQPVSEVAEVQQTGQANSENIQVAQNSGQLNAITVEKEFWEIIENSTDPAMFEAFLEQFPNGMLAPLARVKISKLTVSNPTSETTAPAVRSANVTTPIGAFFISRVRSNVRAKPETSSERISQIEEGERVLVLSEVNNTDWYQVKLTDGTPGYIFKDLLVKFDAAEEAASAEVVEVVMVEETGSLSAIVDVTLFETPSLEAKTKSSIPSTTVVALTGRDEAGIWVEVQTTDGGIGYGIAELFETVVLPTHELIAPSGVREDAALAAAATFRLGVGDQVVLLNQDPSRIWAKIEAADGQSGYVLMDFLTPIEVAVAEPPPPPPPHPDAGIYEALAPTGILATPKLGASEISRVALGNSVTVVDRDASEQWFQVLLDDGDTGFIISDFLKKTGELPEDAVAGLGDKDGNSPEEVAEARRQLANVPATVEEITPAVSDSDGVPDDVFEPDLGGSFTDCAICPVMVPLQSATFAMGANDEHPSSAPRHEVTLNRPFSIGRFEVTYAEWSDCVDAKACDKISQFGDPNPNSPVQNISHDDAIVYVRWLSKVTGKRYRLPTESEWEYAARAGSTTRYWWGDDTSDGKANCAECGGPYDRKRPADVLDFPANPFGLYGTHGGVAEWVADCWHKDFAKAPGDGTAFVDGDDVCRVGVLRGGSWKNKAGEVTSAARQQYDADVRYYVHGFRVARDYEW